jgi:hypothetical protein
MARDPRRIAMHLGFDPMTIGRLGSRGHLHKLALTEPEIRRRLYRAHRTHLQTKGKRTMDVTMTSERRARPSTFAVALAAAAIGAGATAGAYQAFSWAQNAGSGIPSAPGKPSAPEKPSTPGKPPTPAAVAPSTFGSDSCFATGLMHAC